MHNVSKRKIERTAMVWDAEGVEFTVVVNHEEQYSIWPTYRDLPAGWREAGMRGSKEVCLNHIKEVWTDMRPLSLRKAMAEDASCSPETAA
jgi:MbtH protein